MRDAINLVCTDEDWMLGMRDWKCGQFDLPVNGDMPLIMGVLNVTPDSFSDGGCFVDVDVAVAHAADMIAHGAAIIDVGGESTRPGAEPVLAAEEIWRVEPVIREVSKLGFPVSIDTFKAETAIRAIEAGASIVNDISGLEDDSGMIDVICTHDVGVVVMHKQGVPATMQESPEYDDIVDDVIGYLQQRVEFLVERGVSRDRICVDPGIGFGKLLEHNLALLRNIDLLRDRTGCPVLVGLSRKSMIGQITGCKVDDRLAGSLAGLCFCMTKGVDIMRVHDVKESVDAAKMISQLSIFTG
ncbi:MAG: dihydropteroate synthase [Kiritimatiellae bacterium]|jgi:dihydropteroate synthase|nr:dihydropteroate synthase [Kiritimatiellia bacterium]